MSRQSTCPLFFPQKVANSHKLGIEVKIVYPRKKKKPPQNKRIIKKKDGGSLFYKLKLAKIKNGKGTQGNDNQGNHNGLASPMHVTKAEIS